MRIVILILKGIVILLGSASGLLLLSGGLLDIPSPASSERIVALIALPGAVCYALAVALVWTRKFRLACFGLFVVGVILAYLAFDIHPIWRPLYYEGEAKGAAFMYLFGVLVAFATLVPAGIGFYLEWLEKRRSSQSAQLHTENAKIQE